MDFRPLFILWTLVLSALFAPNAIASETHFQTGIAAFQKGDGKQARASFEEALKTDESNPTLLFNLGLVVQNEGQLGLALGLWRKALVFQPNFPQAKQAITWTEGQLEQKQIPHEVTLWESLRAKVLVEHSLNQFLGLTALLFFASGWLLLKYLGRRRRALLEERSLPPFPFITLVSGVFFLTAVCLSAAKAYDQNTLRGTITAKKIEARSAADIQATSLFDLYEGLEVIIRQSQGDWVQVTYPGASTGWIPKSSVFTTMDKATP